MIIVIAIVMYGDGQGQPLDFDLVRNNWNP